MHEVHALQLKVNQLPPDFQLLPLRRRTEVHRDERWDEKRLNKKNRRICIIVSELCTLRITLYQSIQNKNKNENAEFAGKDDSRRLR